MTHTLLSTLRHRFASSSRQWLPAASLPPIRLAWTIAMVGMLFASNAVSADVIELRDPDGDGSQQVIRMTVTPADEPQPAFKYRLCLLPHQQVPGNSVAHYMRAFPEGGIETDWQRVREEFGEEVDDWYTLATPSNQIPVDRLTQAARSFYDTLENFVLPGTRCRDTDWGVSFVDVKGPGILTFRLPEYSGLRSMSRSLALQARLAIVEKDYDRAMELIRANYRLGRDAGNQPILVSVLVGTAISGLAEMSTMQLMAAPNSPNLYWAISELPRPQVPLREAMRTELAIGPRMFEVLDHPDELQLANDEWNRRWKQLAHADQFFGAEDPDSVSSRFQPLAFGFSGYRHASQRLVAWGYDPDEVKAMAVGKVLCIYSARVYQTLANACEKSLYQDWATARPMTQRFDAMFASHMPGGDAPDREIVPIANLLLPAVSQIMETQCRSQRQTDALRVIEALRMHAARNNDQWPQSLQDVTCVPVPLNPATNRPFNYDLDGETAVVTLPMSDGLRTALRFELTIAR